MEIVKVGTNTKNAEGIKISRKIRAAFEKYLKAKQALKETVVVDGEEISYDKITVEQLYVSYLATFENSEDYKATEKAKADKDEADKKKANAAKKDKEDAVRETLKAQGIEGDKLEELVKALTATKKKGRKKAEKKDAEKATEQEEKN